MTTDVAWIVALLAAAITLLAMPASIGFAARRVMLDEAKGRQGRNGVVTRAGGLAMGVAVLVTLIGGPILNRDGRLLLAGLAVAAFAGLGLMDDFESRSPLLRLGAQVAIAVAVAIALAPEVLRGPQWISIALAAVGLVGVVNVFNFMDGIDGISALTSTIIGAWLLVNGIRFDADTSTILAATALGCAAGFGPWNRPPAKVFLGDSGAYLLGAALALSALLAVDAGAPIIATCLPFSLYVADVGHTLFRRALRGDSLLGRHREFAFHRLAMSRMGDVGTLAVVGVVTGVLVVLAWGSIGLSQASTVLVLGGAALLLLAYLAMPRMLRISGLTRLDDYRPSAMNTSSERPRDAR